MSNLIYLVIAIALILVGSLILYLRHREPKGIEAGMKQFSKGLQALAPEDSTRRTGGGRNRTG